MNHPPVNTDEELLGPVGQAMVNALPILVSYIDTDLMYRFCNQAYEDWFQISRDEIVGRKAVPDVVGEETFAEIQPYIARVLSGETCTYEKPLTLPNGIVGHFRSRYLPHRDTAGNVIGYFALVENITERRESELRLADRQRTLQLALDAGRFGTWVADIKSRIAELDATLAGIIQLPAEEHLLPLDTFVELIVPEDRERIASAVERTISGEADFSEQYRQLLPDGSYVWLSTYGRIHRDEAGVADRVIGVTHDITQQKQAEEQLRSLNADLQSRAAEHAEALQMSDASLSAIIATAADAIITVSDQHTILSANPSAISLFGGNDPTNALVGLSVDQLLKSISLEAGEEGGDPAPATEGIPVSRPTLAQRLDGSEFSAEFSIAHAAGVPFSVVLVRDVSERREFEGAVLRAAEDEKERIARDLHDGLGSLLGGVTCLAKALEKELENTSHPSVEKAIQIGNAAQESVTMTRQLAHGLYAVGAEPDALVEALREFVQTTDVSFAARCRFDCPKPVEVNDRVTANHLFRIAQEAVNNSVRHSASSLVTVSLIHELDELVLSVNDNGSGLGVDRVDNGKAEGLGMRTMRYRAGDMHGSLTIASTPAGTTVTCRVPR